MKEGDKNLVDGKNYIAVPATFATYWASVLEPGDFLVLFCLFSYLKDFDSMTVKLTANALLQRTGLKKDELTQHLTALEDYKAIEIGEAGKENDGPLKIPFTFLCHQMWNQ